jgi:succinoglycan biosynthesis transport protein ExoP
MSSNHPSSPDVFLNRMPPVDPLPVIRSPRGRTVSPSSAALSLPLVIPARTQRKGLDDDPASDLMAFLRANYRTLAAVTFAGIVLAWVFNKSQTPTYRASASLEIQDLNENFLNLRDVSQVSIKEQSASGSDLPTQLRLLQSASLLERVVKHLPEEKIPPPAGLAALLASGPMAPPALEARVDGAAQNLQVRDSRSTRIVDLTFESPDPSYAAAFVNQLAQEYISQSIESRLEISQGTSAWLERQMTDLRAKLADSENRLQNYARGNGLVVTAQENRPDEIKLRQIQESLSKAQENRAVRQARMETAIAAPLDSIEAPLGSALRDHQAKLAELRRQRADLITIYTADFDGIKRIDAQIASLENAWRTETTAVLQALKNDYTDAVRRESLLHQSYQEQVGEVTAQGQVAIQYGILKREVDTNRQLYNTLMQRAAEAKVASALRASGARLVDSAKIPKRPFRPQRMMNLLWGASAGLLFGLVLVTARDRIDKRIRRPTDLTFHLQVPQLGSIPRFRTLLAPPDERLGAEAGIVRLTPDPAAGFASMAMATWTHRNSTEAQAYRAVLTSILFSQVADRIPQVIVVTSAQPGDGKTTLVTNLAAALAQMKRTVLLVDASRERGLHRVFGQNDNYGLSDLLDLPEINHSLLAYVTHATPLPGVSLVATGPRETSALDLLYDMAPLLNELRPAFDTLLIDAPSISELPDARVFGRMADGVILVVRAGETTRDTAQAAASRLQEDGTVLLGTVLNQSS